MKSIQVKILPSTSTLPARLKVSTDESYGLTVSLGSCFFFPEKVACGEIKDQADYLADHYLRKVLEWDTDNNYRLVGGSFKTSYFYNLVYTGK